MYFILNFLPVPQSYPEQAFFRAKSHTPNLADFQINRRGHSLGEAEVGRVQPGFLIGHSVAMARFSSSCRLPHQQLNVTLGTSPASILYNAVMSLSSVSGELLLWKCISPAPFSIYCSKLPVWKIYCTGNDAFYFGGSFVCVFTAALFFNNLSTISL